MQHHRDFSKAQQNHFWLVHVLPWLAIPIVLSTQDLIPVTLFEPALLLCMWFLTGGLGISVGFHRHFSHRAFAAKPQLRMLLAYLGQMAGQGPVIYWVALHRTHHQFSDSEGDPHSPITNQQTSRGKLAAFLFGHISWVSSHPIPKLQRYALDLVRDASVRKINDRYWISLLAGILLPAIIGEIWHVGLYGAFAGALWGGLFRLAIGNQIIWAVNSVCHKFGSRPYNTNDGSRNNILVATL